MDCYIWYSEGGGTGRGLSPPRPLLAVANVTAHPSAASVPTQTRGHKYKLYKHQSNVNASKYFFCNRIYDTWNALPHTVVEAPSLNTFKRLLNNVAVCHVAVLP